MELSKRITYSRIIFSTGIVLLSSLCGLFLYETYQENLSSRVVHHSNLVSQSLERIFSTLHERESSLRGYLLTAGTDRFENSPYERKLDAQFHFIDSLLADNDRQTTNLKQLKKLSAEKMIVDDSLLSSRINEKVIPQTLVNSVMRNGAIRTEKIRLLINEMQRTELSIAKELELDAQKHTILATLIGVSGSMFSMVIFILAFYFIDQELKRTKAHVDETRQLNEKVAQFNTELENANQNLQQLNQELGAKNFQLEKYAKEISSFTHITSHDMQEPLRKIEFFISMIEEREKGNLSEEGKRIFGKILQSVARMRKLFLSMLEFSMTNTASNPFESVALNEVLKLTKESLQSYIQENNAVIKSDSLPEVNGIKYQFIQLFENIIGNAIKFRKKDMAPEIRISCDIIDTTKETTAGLKSNSLYYRIKFLDNGIGFDRTYAEKIFQIFQRLSPAQDTFGVGIGLTIARKVAENHGGTLIADSELHIGSVFTFYVPKT